MTTTLKDHYLREYHYGEWANREILAALSRLVVPPPRACVWMAHIIAAETLWIDRITGAATGIPVWPEWTPEECGPNLKTVNARWKAFLSEATPERLENALSYTNSKGEAHTSVVVDIVTHVAFHAAYHRGQIASEMRTSGHTPPYTDFIHATRLGLLE